MLKLFFREKSGRPGEKIFEHYGKDINLYVTGKTDSS